MRDNVWLAGQLAFLTKKYFADVANINPIEIKFGREAKFRFGSIKLVSDRATKRRRDGGLRSLIGIGDVPKKSVITITSLFASESVPVAVVQYTISHELCHYAHGFSSSNKRLF